jgi:carbonic anhydrase
MRPSRTFLIICCMESRAVNALGMAGVVSLGGSTGDASLTRVVGPGIMEVVTIGVLKRFLFRID